MPMSHKRNDMQHFSIVEPKLFFDRCLFMNINCGDLNNIKNSAEVNIRAKDRIILKNN